MEDGVGVASAAVDGASAEPELLPDGRYRVTVSNIRAHQLGERHEVAVRTSRGAEARAEVSALSYVSALLADDAYKDDAQARLAVTALYRYWDAAAKYLEATGGGGA